MKRNINKLNYIAKLLTHPARSVGHVLVGELEPLDQLLGGDVVLQIQAAEQLFYLRTQTHVSGILSL